MHTQCADPTSTAISPDFNELEHQMGNLLYQGRHGGSDSALLDQLLVLK